MEILKNDSDILVCVKPAGVLSENSPSKGVSVQDEYGEGKLFTVHRLDRETGGVMVFARNSKSAAALSKQITDGKIEKRYIAVVNGTPEEKKGIYEDLLFRDKQKNKTYIVNRMRKGVRDAKLEYDVLETVNNKSLIEILLHTGRTHQIRAQFSGRGMPLCGDGRYGGGAGELSLFAYSISFTHPKTGERLTFKAMPEMSGGEWSLFGKEGYEALLR